MNINEYGEIINGDGTYKVIANRLLNGESVLIGWTDEEFTHYDILFNFGAYRLDNNYIQRGIRDNDLFVSVMGKGAFGFKYNTLKDAGYIDEKLDIWSDDFTALINGIIKELNVGVKEQIQKINTILKINEGNEEEC